MWKQSKRKKNKEDKSKEMKKKMKETICRVPPPQVRWPTLEKESWKKRPPVILILIATRYCLLIAVVDVMLVYSSTNLLVLKSSNQKSLLQQLLIAVQQFHTRYALPRDPRIRHVRNGPAIHCLGLCGSLNCRQLRYTRYNSSK